MKILSSHHKTVIIASDKEGNCPRSILTSKNVKIGDDFYGKIKFGKRFLTKVLKS